MNKCCRCCSSVQGVGCSHSSTALSKQLNFHNISLHGCILNVFDRFSLMIFQKLAFQWTQATKLYNCEWGMSRFILMTTVRHVAYLKPVEAGRGRQAATALWYEGAQSCSTACCCCRPTLVSLLSLNEQRTPPSLPLTFCQN